MSGFSEFRWAVVQKMRPGDRLLCYLTRASRWVGVLEVAGEPYYDESDRIWQSASFPSRVPVRPLIALEPEIGVPVLDMRDDLSVFQGLSNPNRWSGPFRGSPAGWKTPDGEAVLAALQDAQAHPVRRDLKPRPGRRVESIEVADAVVTVPEDEDSEVEAGRPAVTAHTEIQHMLLKLGAEMGFDVYVARNDQNREWQGQRLGAMPRRRETVPGGFDAATTRVIELIDVLWLDKNHIAATFEIESTTTVYSGLLRMSDLITMQPNISIPLFIVAPEDRRHRVIQQVNRPTFERRDPPLSEVCRFISFEGLRDALERVHGVIRYLKPDYLQEISDSCAID